MSDEYSSSKELKKFCVGYHKAIRKIVNAPYFYSNHHVCNSFNLLMFNHYINWISIRFAFRVIKSKNMLFMKLNNFFRHDSMLIRKVYKICNNYGIKDSLNNDIDAIKARIFYVQRNEAHSNAFGYLNEVALQ